MKLTTSLKQPVIKFAGYVLQKGCPDSRGIRFNYSGRPDGQKAQIISSGFSADTFASCEFTPKTKIEGFKRVLTFSYYLRAQSGKKRSILGLCIRSFWIYFPLRFCLKKSSTFSSLKGQNQLPKWVKTIKNIFQIFLRT